MSTKEHKRLVSIVAVRDGRGWGLYADECCSVGTCLRPPGHEGRHDAFDGPRSSDSVPLHPLTETVHPATRVLDTHGHMRITKLENALMAVLQAAESGHEFDGDVARLQWSIRMMKVLREVAPLVAHLRR